MYKYLQSDNNFQFYTMDGMKPKEDHIPLPSQADLADKESFGKYTEYINMLLTEKGTMMPYEQRLAIFKQIKEARWQMFKDDLSKEAGTLHWPDECRNQLFSKVWEEHHSSGLQEVVDFYISEAEWMENFLYTWNLNKKT